MKVQFATALRVVKALILIVAIVILVRCGSPQSAAPPPQNSTVPSDSSNSVSVPGSATYAILAEQKAASDTVTRHAVELLKADQMGAARKLYKDHWNDLATVRTDLLLRSDLSASDKQLVDATLKADQESVTAILSKYEEL